MATVGIRDAARLLGVSTDTIRRRIERGDLSAHKDARGRWVIEVEESMIAPPPAPATEVAAEREEVIRLRAENQALQALLDEVRSSRDRTVEAEAELRRILALFAVRRRGIGRPEADQPEAVMVPRLLRRWWQRRRPAVEPRPEDDPDRGDSEG